MDTVERMPSSVHLMHMMKPKYESSKVALDPATSLSMLGSRPFGALMCDSAMALKITGLF